MNAGDGADVDAVVGAVEFELVPALLVESIPFEDGVAPNPRPTAELPANDEVTTAAEVVAASVIVAMAEDAAVVSGGAVEHETAVGRFVTPFALHWLMA